MQYARTSCGSMHHRCMCRPCTHPLACMPTSIHACVRAEHARCVCTRPTASSAGRVPAREAHGLARAPAADRAAALRPRRSAARRGQGADQPLVGQRRRQGEHRQRRRSALAAAASAHQDGGATSPICSRGCARGCSPMPAGRHATLCPLPPVAQDPARHPCPCIYDIRCMHALCRTSRAPSACSSRTASPRPTYASAWSTTAPCAHSCSCCTRLRYGARSARPPWWRPPPRPCGTSRRMRARRKPPPASSQ
jgi:hypothetical protein